MIATARLRTNHADTIATGASVESPGSASPNKPQITYGCHASCTCESVSMQTPARTALPVIRILVP